MYEHETLLVIKTSYICNKYYQKASLKRQIFFKNDISKIKYSTLTIRSSSNTYRLIT